MPRQQLMQSVDGEPGNWKETGVTFRSKKAVNEYLSDRFGASDVLDWRVGWLLKVRYGVQGTENGLYFKVVNL